VERTLELPVNVVKHSGRSAFRSQPLKERRESYGTDSFVERLDALDPQATASITISAIARLQPRGSELCTDAAVSTSIVTNLNISHAVLSLRIRHAAPHQQSK
jgi:hypothetical protein